MKYALMINGKAETLEVDESMPLLWVLRDVLGLTGTKFGCGIGACGACTVHLNGQAVRSCVVPIHTAAGAEITTIEGLGMDGPHPVQQAWIDRQVSQCGYCQPGMIMAVAALLAENPTPSEEDIHRSVTNICSCGTYVRVREAIRALRGV